MEFLKVQVNNCYESFFNLNPVYFPSWSGNFLRASAITQLGRGKCGQFLEIDKSVTICKLSQILANFEKLLDLLRCHTMA